MAEVEVILLRSAETDLLEILIKESEDMYQKIDDALEHIRLNQEIGPQFYDRFHRKLVLKTPYAIFYAIEGNRIMVAFVMDLRQSPDSILDRLSDF